MDPHPASIDRGDVFWAEPGVPGYPHPHVAVQDDVFNRPRVATVVVSQVSSAEKDRLGNRFGERIGTLFEARV